jgi:hypothetical protein
VYDNMSDLSTRSISGPDAVRRVVEKADRAVGLAMTGGDDRPSFKSALEHVQRLADTLRAAHA